MTTITYQKIGEDGYPMVYPFIDLTAPLCAEDAETTIGQLKFLTSQAMQRHGHTVEQAREWLMKASGLAQTAHQENVGEKMREREDWGDVVVDRVAEERYFRERVL
jgi:hypothetical protein